VRVVYVSNKSGKPLRMGVSYAKRVNVISDR
jgi:hypothetical protein